MYRFRKQLRLSNNFYYRTVSNNKQKKTQITARDEDADKPIEYLRSEAAIFKAKEGRSGTISTAPWYQSYVISISLGVFMIYFFILREENDIDTEFDKTLYERISGLEEKNLDIVLKYNKKQGLATSDIEKRLAEIQQDSNSK